MLKFFGEVNVLAVQKATSVLPAEQIDLADVHGLVVAENRDDDGESHDRFCGSDCEGEKDQYLSLDIAVKTAKREEGEVHGIEHKFHAHEDDDCVAANEHADNADRKHDRTQCKKPIYI